MVDKSSGEVWTVTDEEESKRLFIALLCGELNDEQEKVKLSSLVNRKARLKPGTPETRRLRELLKNSIALVNDMEADGANFTPEENVEMTVLLVDAGDNMIARYSLIKKAARGKKNQ